MEPQNLQELKNVDLFTSEFKRLKSRKPPPNLDKVIDLYNPCFSLQGADTGVVRRLELPFANSHSFCGMTPRESDCPRDGMAEDSTLIAGLKPVDEWKAFEFLNIPGFYVITNPFVDGYQRYWVSQCLQDLPSDGNNINNMSGQNNFNYKDVWREFLKRPSMDKQDPVRKLRWTTLGYHHNWNTKVYSEDDKAIFPLDIYLLSQCVARGLGFRGFKAEAAIVNYYHMDSTLAGHTDHSEIDQTAPLISVSFGQTAIFLVGGETKAVEPAALYLRSGDICVMSGRSRLAYHAVPKILPPWSPAEARRLNDAFTLPVKHVGLSSHSEAQTEDKLSLDTVCSTATGRGAKPEGKDSPTTEKTVLMPEFSADESESQEWPSSSCIGSKHDLQSDSSGLCDTSNHTASSQFTSKLREVNSHIVASLCNLDFQPFETYLSSSRINLNIRQVLPPGISVLP